MGCAFVPLGFIATQNAGDSAVEHTVLQGLLHIAEGHVDARSAKVLHKIRLRGARHTHLAPLQIGQAVELLAAEKDLISVARDGQHFDLLVLGVVIIKMRTESLDGVLRHVDRCGHTGQVESVVDSRLTCQKTQHSGSYIKKSLPQQFDHFATLETHFVPRLEGDGDGSARSGGNSLRPHGRFQFF
ncbi:hypothetical protein D9M68_760600 [compost metagenome]